MLWPMATKETTNDKGQVTRRNEKGLRVIPTALAFMVIADARSLERFAFAQVTDETGSDSE